MDTISNTYIKNIMELKFVFNKLYNNGKISKEEYTKSLAILEKGNC